MKYTNGVGHFWMSVFFGLVGLVLMIFPGMDAATKAIGISLLLTVQAAWFIPGAAKQVAYQMQNLQASTPASSQPASVPTLPTPEPQPLLLPETKPAVVADTLKLPIATPPTVGV